MLRLGSLSVLGALLISASACSDSKATTPITLKTNEGGGIIFEYIYLDSNLQKAFGLPAGVTSIERTMAYFANSMTPDHNPTPIPGQCNNLDATKGWPLYIGQPAVELDVGTLTITGVNKAGSPTTLNVAQKQPGKDAIGRTHNGVYYQDITPVADTVLQPDSAYDVAFGGSSDVKATTLKGPLYMTATFQVSDPPFEGAPAMVAGQDYTIHWTPTTSVLPTDQNYAGWGASALGLTWLADTNGSPAMLCPTYHKDGQFTIKGQDITDYKAVATARGTDPTHALLLRQSVVHTVEQLPNNDPKNVRRMDMVAIMCWAQLVAVN